MLVQDRPWQGSYRSNGQAVTTFGATGPDYGTTATGRHANEEAVRALAANNRRLIGTFHG
jgi:hypothetical protein